MFAKVSLLVASTVLLSAGAQATEAVRTPMVLTAYSNGPGGVNLTTGHYAEALAEIQRFKPQMMIAASAKATNLCVAHTAARQFEQAKTACDMALRQAKYDRLSGSQVTPGLSHHNAYVAIAYANRAVLSMLSRDEASAKADLERAQALAPNAEFVSRNMRAVARVARNTLAQVTLEVAPSR